MFITDLGGMSVAYKGFARMSEIVDNFTTGHRNWPVVFDL